MTKAKISIQGSLQCSDFMSKKINKKKSIASRTQRHAAKRHVPSARANPQQASKKALIEKKRLASRAAAAATRAVAEKKQNIVDASVRKEQVVRVIERMLGNERVSSYIRQNVSKRAPEVLQLLDVPRTDEEISRILDVKINTARRVLNILQGYGVTNYTTRKDSKGWLSFFWYINTEKIDQFFEYVLASNKSTILTSNCNDYFVCKSCYDENKLVFNFDSAFEAGFKCTCNRSFARVDREYVREALVNEIRKASEPGL